MGALFCKCCCPCKSLYNNNNSVGVQPEEHLKILILGPTGSGKTEVAHLLSKTQRTDFETTNGSKFYQTEIPMENGSTKQKIGLTEIGGSVEMQRIWHHYFPSTMAIIFCFDMSASFELLYATFQLLDQVLAHSFVRGKSILLIGTKSDLADDGLQLYDIENAFQLPAMAQKYECSMRMCQLGREDELDLWQSVLWLIHAIKDNYEVIKVRIKGDTNMKAWHEQTQKLIAAGKLRRWSYRRFPIRNSKRRKHKMFWKYGSLRVATLRQRPSTAPSAVYSIYKSSRDNSSISWHNSNDTVDTTATVPIETQNSESKEDLLMATHSKQVTDI